MSASTRIEATELRRPYGRIAQSFHWVMVGLIVLQVSLALILPSVLPKTAEAALQSWHLSVGSTILVVMLLRLVWRATHTPPPPPADLSPPLQVLSRATHWGFYAILIGLPLLGWTAASAYGATVRLFGLIPLPALVATDTAFGERVGQVHGTLAMVLLALIALHVAGVLYHGLVKRDGVVRRMLDAPDPQVSAQR